MTTKSFSEKNCINIKQFSAVLTALFALSVIPLIVIGFFNFPSADDFSMAFETHEKFVQTGNVFVTLGYAFYMGFWYYMNWTGYFFSAALTSMCPSIFDEKLYFLTSIIVLGMVIAGAFVFFDAALVKRLGMSKDIARVLCLLILFAMIQSMPAGTARNEAFYWYSGAINYSFMFGLGLLWLGLLIRLEISSKKGLLVTTCILGFLLGGANYMTALSLAVVSFCIIVLRIIKKINKEECNIILVFPALLNIVGLLVSAVAPGNKVRGEALNSLNPIVAIIRSVYHAFDLCINDWMHWEVIVILAIIAVFAFCGAGMVKIRFEHPALFSTFCFLMVAVNIVPPLFATGNFDAGRMSAIIWMQFVLMMAFIVFYNCVWLRQSWEDRFNDADKTANVLGPMASRAVIVLVMFLTVGLMLSIYVDRGYITSTSAVSDLVSGNAAVYQSENYERLEILKNTDIDAAELAEHQVKPELLFFSDITEETADWLNMAVAEYYGKTSVKLRR